MSQLYYYLRCACGDEEIFKSQVAPRRKLPSTFALLPNSSFNQTIKSMSEYITSSRRNQKQAVFAVSFGIRLHMHILTKGFTIERNRICLLSMKVEFLF